MIFKKLNQIFLTTLICLLTASAFAQTAEKLYETGMYEYNQINYSAAISNFRRAAELGHAASQAKLGTLLDAAEEDEAAREWFNKAVDQENIEGQMGLARMMALGEGGEKDMAGAVKLYVAAAENGSLEAMRILYTANRDGNMDLKVNPERADYWLERAAQEGDQWSRQQIDSQNRTN